MSMMNIYTNHAYSHTLKNSKIVDTTQKPRMHTQIVDTHKKSRTQTKNNYSSKCPPTPEQFVRPLITNTAPDRQQIPDLS